MEEPKARRLCYIGLGTATLLHLSTALLENSGPIDSFTLALLGKSLLPYGIAFIVMLPFRKPRIALGAIGAILVMDIWMYFNVFVAPLSSTAALGLLFMPFWNLVLVCPLGCLLGWFFIERRALSRKPEEAT
jgi:hypothetical protein